MNWLRTYSTLAVMIVLVATSTSYLACGAPVRSFGEGGAGGGGSSSAGQPTNVGGSGSTGNNGGDGPTTNKN